jgi:hypothetical protein
MQFTLFYEGPLKANGDLPHKHSLRREFHTQLLQLWRFEPLSSHVEKGFLSDTTPPGKLSIVERVGAFRFAPLVNDKLHLKAELDITLLRPETPRGIVGRGGDIDNRMKTLLDSLRMPRNVSEIPRGETPEADGDPFFCLLEDDSLITRLSVGTDRLLKTRKSSSEVVLVIHVTTRASRLSFANLDLA